MTMLLLIARMADQRVALPAEAIESVVEIETVTPVPRVARHIAGLAALRSRVLTVIDARAALELDPTDLDQPVQAATFSSDGHLYGLLLDAVEDVVPLTGAVRPVRAPLDPAWQRVTTGIVEVAGDALLLVSPAAMAADAPVQAAAAA